MRFCIYFYRLDYCSYLCLFYDSYLVRVGVLQSLALFESIARIRVNLGLGDPSLFAATRFNVSKCTSYLFLEYELVA